MKTKYFLLLCTSIIGLYFTACKVIHTPLRYETTLQNKIDPPDEDGLLEWLGSDLAVANQIRETPAITTYLAQPNEPFSLSVNADFVVQELEGLERLLINPTPVSPNDKLELSKLSLNKNNQLLVEITDFGSVFSAGEVFSHALRNLVTPTETGATDHYEFIGYWNDGKSRALAQGIWIDVTATTSENEANTQNEKPDIIRIQGGGTLATKGGKDEYEFGDNTKSPFKPGFLFGASVPYQISSILSIEAGLHVETKGAIEKYAYEDEYEPGQGNVFGFAVAAQLAASSFKQSTSLTYLGVPVTANISPFPQMPEFEFLGGVQPSFLLGRKFKSSGFGSSTTDKSKEGFKGIDMGLLLGAGYRLENGLGFRLAYEHGLTDITKNEFDTFQNRTIKLSATYDIPVRLFNQ